MIRPIKDCLYLSVFISIGYILLLQMGGTNSLKVSYNITSASHNISQLYWKTTNNESVFHENRSVMAHPVSNKIDFYIDKNTNKITIVPIIEESEFSINNLRIYPPESILPIPLVSTKSLNLADAIDIQNISDSENLQFDYKSNTANPIFTFNISRTELLARSLIVNLAIIFLLLLLGRLVSNRTAYKDENRLVKHNHFAWIFILIPALFLLSIITSKFQTPFTNPAFISTFVVTTFLSYLIIALVTKKVINIWSIIGLAVTVYILLPDLSYKLKYIDKKAYTNIYTPVYHWRYPSSSTDNFNNSGAVFITDIIEIEKMISPGSSFISDPVSSYYLLSFLPIYTAVGKPHHGGSTDEFKYPFVNAAFLKHLCEPNGLYNGRSTENYFREKNQLHQAKKWPSIRYIILNKDRKNKAMHRQCLTPYNNAAIKHIETFSNKIYEGSYLDVYEIRTGS